MGLSGGLGRHDRDEPEHLVLVPETRLALITAIVWLVAGIAVGAGGLFLWRRQSERPATPAGVDPLLVPEPALRWLGQARGARAIWAATPAAAEGVAPQWHRVMLDTSCSAEASAMAEDRLELLRPQVGAGTERQEAGILMYRAARGLVAGMLLPDGTPSETLRATEADLLALIDGLARRPLLERAIAEQELPVESLGSIGLRLAYQMERILGAEILVAVATQGTVRVIGTSSRADRRLLDTFAQPGSPMLQVGLGEVASLTSIADPLGGIVHDRRAHLTPAIIYPIRAQDETVGAVAVWTDDDGAPIGPVIAEVQEALRNAGPRMIRARQVEEAGTIAITDPLTGLKNRRGLEDAIHRFGITQGSLIYADFDKFKRLNDTLGHAAGDAALVHFARLVHDTIRGGDTAARIGGEEFAIWLPGASLSYGAKVADRLRIRLATTPWDWQGRSWPLSASFGVSALPDTTRSLENLPAQADAALMDAKRQGRDRVETAKPLSRLERET